MPTILANDVIAEREAAELRAELEDLRNATAALTRALAGSETELEHHRVMLKEALALQSSLEDRLMEIDNELAATRTELTRERLASRVRAMLLTDIEQARPWQRGRAIRRAARVRRLLYHGS